MKKYLIFLLLLLAAGTLRAQSPSGHFEWVRTYTGIQISSAYGYNEIVGSAVDSLGNLYIAGHFTYEGILDANAYTDLYPDSLFATRYINIVIAKFSPSGEMLWHKVIIDQSLGGQGGSGFVRDMKMVGDSSIMVAVNFTVPENTNILHKNVYYLDTLIQDQSYFHPTDSIWPNLNNAFITFDFDGNVTEQHFVSIGLLDELGNPMGYPGFTYIYGLSGFAQKFAVDHKGNIYVLHGMSSDQRIGHSVFNGNVSAQVIYVDGVRHQTNPVGPTPVWSEYQIMKFSPHFDSLLGCTYILDTSTSTDYSSLFELFKINSFNMDKQDNLYCTTYFRSRYEARDTSFSIPIYNSDTLSFNSYATRYPEAGSTPLFCGILKFDSSLQPLRYEQLYSTPNDEDEMDGFYFLTECSYTDESTNSLFLLAYTQLRFFFDSRNSEPLYVIYRNDSIEMQNNHFWLRLDMDSWDLLSYGRVRSTAQTSGGAGEHCSLIAKDNRVCTQFKFWNDFEYQDTTIYAPSSGTGRGLGFMMWDYDGNEIGCAYIQSDHPSNQPGQVHLVDSALYLTGQLFTDATFGDISARCLDYDMAYIVKYVDTSFMHPYVRPGSGRDTTGTGDDTTHVDPPTPPDSGDVRVLLPENGNPFAYYPNPFRQRVNIEYSGTEQIVSAYLTDLSGRREEVRLQPQGNGRYTLDLTSRPQATYLLTLVTQGGQQHVVRLMKMSDIFGN